MYKFFLTKSVIYLIKTPSCAIAYFCGLIAIFQSFISIQTLIISVPDFADLRSIYV